MLLPTMFLLYCRWLSDAGQNVEMLLQSNPAPLNHAVFNNHEEIVCLLLEKDALGTRLYRARKQ